MAIFQRKAGVTGQIPVVIDRQRREFNSETPRLYATDPLDIYRLRTHPNLEEVGSDGSDPDVFLPVVKELDPADTLNDKGQIVFPGTPVVVVSQAEYDELTPDEGVIYAIVD